MRRCVTRGEDGRNSSLQVSYSKLLRRLDESTKRHRQDLDGLGERLEHAVIKRARKLPFVEEAAAAMRDLDSSSLHRDLMDTYTDTNTQKNTYRYTHTYTHTHTHTRTRTHTHPSSRAGPSASSVSGSTDMIAAPSTCAVECQ